MEVECIRPLATGLVVTAKGFCSAKSMGVGSKNILLLRSTVVNVFMKVCDWVVKHGARNTGRINQPAYTALRHVNVLFVVF